MHSNDDKQWEVEHQLEIDLVIDQEEGVKQQDEVDWGGGKIDWREVVKVYQGEVEDQLGGDEGWSVGGWGGDSVEMDQFIDNAPSL